ncbi:MAG: peptidase M14 [Betaproteobacteria bacterium RIFCSPLOWO2_02_FULL_66_14]|nr:MAG: peptidase M14 [Betaproteobacteria bacterium RIFCSPLOWO2_02_FULL_66_14]
MTTRFRREFLDYDALTAQLQAWALAHPAFVRLESIGRSVAGRDLWVLTLGPEPERLRPAVWVDGNMHASELCGSSAALAIAEDVIRLHAEPQAELHGLPAHVCERLREVLFYIMPRMSPDGAEEVLKSGRYVRSVPRDERPNRSHARWISRDVDGDGIALIMRKADPAGEFVESREVPGLLLERTLEDPGPYYKIYPEGVIENFDGVTIPTPNFLSDNQTDLNRNFPFQWYPENEQVGAGSYPMNEPESRAVVEFTSHRPHLFAWLNFHTFGGVYIRPLGDKPDVKMDQEDLAIFRQVAEWGEQHAHYPTVSGFEEFIYEPEKPIRGDLTDYAYHQRGCLAYAVELWDLFEQVGLEKKKRFVDRYTHLERADMEKIARWDAEHNSGRVLRPWKKLDHPQLGEVEVGGLDPRVGLWNPPYERIDEVCRGQSAAFLRVAALAPSVRIALAQASEVASGLYRLDVRVENLGYLATNGLSSARKLDWNEPLVAEIEPQGCALANPREARQTLGHLEGWGHGKYEGYAALYYMRSRGNTGARTLSWTLRGKGSAVVRVGSCRTGWITREIEVG